MLDIQPSNIAPTYAFEVGDELVIGENAWNVCSRLEDGFGLMPKTGPRIVQFFSNSELGNYVQKAELTFKPRIDPILEDDTHGRHAAEFLASRTEGQHQEAKRREAIVLAFRALYERGEVKRTQTSFIEEKEKIKSLAGEINASPDDDIAPVPRKFCFKSVLRRSKSYALFGLIGLYDNFEMRGNRQARLRPEVLKIMTPVIEQGLHIKDYPKKRIWEDVKDAIDEENLRRRENGLPELIRPSRETIRTRINAYDPFLVCLWREGEEEAKRRFGRVGLGVQVSRPLQRVEIDEWKCDLITLLSEAGLWDWLDGEAKKSLGLKKALLQNSDV